MFVRSRRNHPEESDFIVPPESSGEHEPRVPLWRVLIASPRQVFQDAVKRSLGNQAETTSVVKADMDDIGLTTARNTRPDVVVVDMTSVGMSGLCAMAALREQFYYARFVAVSPLNSKSIKITARECGADKLVIGDIHDNSFRRDLLGAILSS